MVVRSLASQWLATGYVAGLSLLLVFVLGRVLGPGGFGAYSYVLSAVSIFAIFLDGGYRTLLFREGVAGSWAIAGGRERVLANALGHVLVALVAGLVLVLFLPATYRAGLAAALVCFALVTVSGLVSAWLKGKGRFHKEALWQVCMRTATAALMVTAVLICPSVPALFGAWALGLAATLALPEARRVWWRRPSFRFNWAILRPCLAFILIDAATAIYFRSDIILLEHLGGDEDAVGNYAASYRLLEGVILLAMPAAHIAFRSLRLHWEDRTEFARRLAGMLAAMVLASVLVVGTGFAAGPLLVDLTFGGEFSQAGALLGWLLCALFFVLPNFILTQAAIALNREGGYALVALVSAGVNVGFNLWLIPAHGALGAAWATLATEAFLLVGLSVVLFRGIRAAPGLVTDGA